MLDRVLRRMRELVRSALYVMTVHGQEEMEADGITLADVEHVFLTGEIVEGVRLMLSWGHRHCWESESGDRGCPARPWGERGHVTR